MPPSGPYPSTKLGSPTSKTAPLLCRPRPKTHASFPADKTGYRSSAPIRCQLGLRSRTVVAVGGGGTAMSTSLKSSPNDIFRLPELGAEKNDLHRDPINDDLAFPHTLGTPKNSRFTRRSHNHGLRNYTHEEATSLMDILEERYHKAPIIF